MVFSSIVFIFTFLPVVILACYLAPVKLRNFVLLLASLVFYAWGEPVYLFLMLYSILFNYVMGLDIAAKQEKGRTGRGSLALGVAVNLVLLGFFKYYGFLAQNLLQLFSIRLPEVTVGLPIGLSFYTFQSISYLADVYRGKAGGQRSLISFGLYISMFPQLVAGPIVQYADIDAQLRKRFTSWELFGEGTRYFVGGLAKKVLLANNLGAVFEAVSGLASLSVLSAWVGALAYAFQIYFDFSGYSDMAIGLGKMLPGKDVRLCVQRKLSFSLLRPERYGILAQMAYLPGLLVPGIRLYSHGRQPRGRPEAHPEPSGCLDADRALARGQLEFCGLGLLLRSAPDRGKVHFAQGSRADSCAGDGLYAAAGPDRLGFLL